MNKKELLKNAIVCPKGKLYRFSDNRSLKTR